MANPRNLFVNIAVRDLNAAKAFFGKLGFEFNAQFTNDDAASMVVGANAFVMLLTEKFFKGFTDRKQCDTRTSTEALLCFSVDSREEVDRVVQTALESGGKKAKDKQDHGFMYAGSFYDLDDHHWEVVWMDPATIQ
jgi:predicted lactoylglutathione lyase